jgi:hypothetical protein
MPLAITNLTAGNDTTNNPATTASISPTSGAIVYLTVGYAGDASTHPNDDIAPSGVMATWEEIGRIGSAGEGRRGIMVFRGSGAITPGTISITVSPSAGNWAETFWSIAEVTGYNAGDPDDAPVGAEAASGTSGAITDVGTIDAGDAVIAAFAHEESESLTITGFTSLSAQTGGTDLRTLHVGYSMSDETPEATWATNAAWQGIAWIVNVDPGGGAAVVDQTHTLVRPFPFHPSGPRGRM